MKLLLIFFGLVIISQEVNAQQLDGEYSFAGVVGESISFNHASKSFEFEHSNCNFALKGKGHYKFKGGKLRLYFENSEHLADPEIPKKQTIIHKDSSLYPVFTVSVWVRDNDDSSKPIANASISFVGTNNGKVTDSLGFARLRYEGSKQIHLQASNICGMEKIKLEEPGDYNIMVFLQCDLYKTYPVKEGEVYTYKIGRLADNWIELTAMQNLEGQVMKYWKRQKR